MAIQYGVVPQEMEGICNILISLLGTVREMKEQLQQYPTPYLDTIAM
jgi:hypothetical protein